MAAARTLRRWGGPHVWAADRSQHITARTKAELHCDLDDRTGPPSAWVHRPRHLGQTMTRTPVGGPEPQPPYDWVSAAVAADMLSVPVREVYRLVDTGQLPGYRIDGEIRLLAHEVAEYREAHPTD